MIFQVCTNFQFWLKSSDQLCTSKWIEFFHTQTFIEPNLHNTKLKGIWPNVEIWIQVQKILGKFTIHSTTVLSFMITKSSINLGLVIFLVPFHFLSTDQLGPNISLYYLTIKWITLYDLVSHLKRPIHC